jgi:hypothetical protein
MNAWTPIAACAPAATPSGGGSSSLFMEMVEVTLPNTLAHLTNTPDGAFIMLVLNGRTFLPLGTSPPFSVAGQVITWLSTVWGLAPGDEVNVAYSVGSA